MKDNQSSSSHSSLEIATRLSSESRRIEEAEEDTRSEEARQTSEKPEEQKVSPQVQKDTEEVYSVFTGSRKW